MNLGGSQTTVTREVVREAPVAPLPPVPVTCQYCGGSYLPVDTGFACPKCGANAPQNVSPQAT